MLNRVTIALTACLALFLSACATRSQNLIVGKWEVASARTENSEMPSPIKISAEFNPDGTARLTMMGQTLQANYKLNGADEMEWTVNGITKKSRIHVTETELELTDDENRTIKYTRK